MDQYLLAAYCKIDRAFCRDLVRLIDKAFRVRVGGMYCIPFSLRRIETSDFHSLYSLFYLESN